MRILQGIGVSTGIQIGKVLILESIDTDIKKTNIVDGTEEINRLKDGIDVSKKEIVELQKKTYDEIGVEEAHIFAAHLMILEDPEYIEQIIDKVKIEKVNAEYAVQEITDIYVKIFADMDDEYLKERVADIIDVSRRLIRILMGVKMQDISNLSEEIILVAHDLTPSETAQMDKEKVLGFITEIGGKTSHSAIMARTLEIPAVVGVRDGLKELKNNEIVIIDGEAGSVIISPERSLIESYLAKKEEYKKYILELENYRGKKSLTMDGKEVELVANIGTVDDISGVLKNDSEGIGLFRTEFLYMNRSSFPSEEEQYNAYKKIAESLSSKPVIIRTLDIGGDKELPYLNLPEEMNPFLGYRAIRLCLDRKDIFITQLRAILRASTYGKIKIMFPMISSIEELREAKEVLEEVKGNLSREKIKFNENIEVGIMVEIPAVAVLSDIFAEEVDFFSIGTNDLIQYTTAVDRMNQEISHLYTQYHPAVLRLIKQVIDNGHSKGIWVGMCGEAAGDSKLIPLLIGMGLDEFSMSASLILKARKIISQFSMERMSEVVGYVLNLSTAIEVENYLTDLISEE